MLLSISNSSGKSWFMTGLLAATIWVLCLFFYENTLRKKGHAPTVADSQQLWSQERDRVSGSNAIVFAGASRTLYGIDLSTVQALLPDSKPVMLALNGRYPVATLRYLAEESDFNGTLLLDIDARGLADYYWDAQLPANRYFLEEWTPNWAVHRRILNVLQTKLSLLNPRLGFFPMLKSWLGFSPPPFLSHASLASTREGSLDFDKVDATRLANMFKAGLEGDLKAHPPKSPKQWLEALAPLKVWVSSIERRGGSVIFYVPPVSGHQFDLSQEAYPRELYWQKFINHYELKGWNFEDYPEIRSLPLPDSSHVSASMKPRYTALLLSSLSGAGLL